MDNFVNTQVILQKNHLPTQTSTGSSHLQTTTLQNLQQTQTAPLSNKPSPKLTNTLSTQQIDFTVIPNGQVFQGKVLGSGGFGIIYAGSWKTFQVAIKILRAKDNRLQEEFLNESKIMAHLKHSRIVRFFGIGKNPLMMVMELLPRGDLSNLLSNPKQQLPWEPNRWRWALDIGAGVAYLHSQNIFHRDLKSQNVLLDASLRAKIADFGLSLRKTTSDLILDRQAGSIPWMAPELFSKQVKLTAASDVYAYGMTLWEIASRKLPFVDALNQDIIPNWIQDGEREDIPADCPKPVADIIQACWAQDPTKRPSALEVLASLKKAKPESVPDLPETESDAFSKIIEILRVLVTFIGRKDHLTALKKNLADDWQPKGFTRIQVITGLGGVGKSELACQFANQSIPQFDLIYWIPSETQFQRENAFRDLAAKLGVYLDKEDKYPTIRKRVYRNLEEHSFEKPYLLIFDNLEEKEVFPFGNGSILITAQNSQPYHPQQVLTVKSFTEAEAIEFVQTTTKETDLKSIKTLVDLLGNFPLAIDKACAYINKEKTTVSQYLEKLDIKSLLKESGTERHKLSLLATWQLTLKVLDPLAVEWLTLCAYLAPNNIPASWITTWLKQQKKDTTNGDSILRSLRNYGLIDYSYQGGPFSIHRLLQQILRTTKTEEYYHQALSLIAEAGKPFDQDKTETWEIGKGFLPHARSLLAHNLLKQADQKILAGLLAKTGEVEAHLTNYDVALTHFEQSLAINKKIYGNEHPKVAKSLTEIGVFFMLTGAHDQALIVLREAYAILNEVHGYESTEVAKLGLMLAAVCKKNETREDLSLPYAEHALNIYKKVYGNVHPKVAQSLSYLGLLLGTAEGIVHLKQALEIRKKVYGNEHPKVATSLTEVGEALVSIGKNDEGFIFLKQALEIHKTTLKTNKKIYGDEHLKVATSLTKIGETVRSLKEFDEAIAYYKKALMIIKKIYDDKHPDIATLLDKIGYSLWALKKYDESLTYYRQAVAVLKQCFGSENYAVADTLSQIGHLLSGQRKLNEALIYFNQALRIFRKLRADGPCVAKTLSFIGEQLHSLGKYREAHLHYTESLNLFQKIYRGGSYWFAMTANQAGLNLIYLKNYEQAYVHLEWARIMTERVLPNDLFMAEVLNNLGFALYNQKKSNEALIHYNQSLTLYKKNHGDENSEVADLMDRIGMALFSQGKSDEALGYHKQALDIHKKVYGNEHIKVARAMQRMAWLNAGQKKFQKAFTYSMKTLTVFKKAHGDIHPDVATALKSIGDVLACQQRLEESLFYHKEALQTRKKLYGDTHPDVARSMTKIGGILESMGNLDRALPIHSQALEIWKKLRNSQREIALCQATVNRIANAILVKKGFGPGARFKVVHKTF